jgi:hypothetical protein
MIVLKSEILIMVGGSDYKRSVSQILGQGKQDNYPSPDSLRPKLLISVRDDKVMAIYTQLLFYMN